MRTAESRSPSYMSPGRVAADGGIRSGGLRTWLAGQSLNTQPHNSVLPIRQSSHHRGLASVQDKSGKHTEYSPHGRAPMDNHRSEAASVQVACTSLFARVCIAAGVVADAPEDSWKGATEWVCVVVSRNRPAVAESPG